MNIKLINGNNNTYRVMYDCQLMGTINQVEANKVVCYDLVRMRDPVTYTSFDEAVAHFAAVNWSRVWGKPMRASNSSTSRYEPHQVKQTKQRWAQS